MAQPNHKSSKVPILSSSHWWFLCLVIAETKDAQRTKYIEGRNCGCYTVSGEIDKESLKEKLETCKHFPVDFEMENRRHRFLNFAFQLRKAHTLGQTLDTVYEELKCAAKLNGAFGFVHKIVGDGTCLY